MNFFEELEEAFRLLAECLDAPSLEEEFRDLADLATVPETPQEKRNPVEGLRSAKLACHLPSRNERWHTAATGE